jgi:ribonuclease R
MAEFGLPFRYPEAPQSEANEKSRIKSLPKKSRPGRFPEVTTFTIDPADAPRTSMMRFPIRGGNGNLEVGVHI